MDPLPPNQHWEVLLEVHTTLWTTVGGTPGPSALDKAKRDLVDTVFHASCVFGTNRTKLSWKPRTWGKNNELLIQIRIIIHLFWTWMWLWFEWTCSSFREEYHLLLTLGIVTVICIDFKSFNEEHQFLVETKCDCDLNLEQVLRTGLVLQRRIPFVVDTGDCDCDLNWLQVIQWRTSIPGWNRMWLWSEFGQVLLRMRSSFREEYHLLLTLGIVTVIWIDFKSFNEEHQFLVETKCDCDLNLDKQVLWARPSEKNTTCRRHREWVDLWFELT